MSELITAQNLELVIKKNHEIKEEVLAQAIRLQTNPSIMKVASAPQLALLILQGFGLIQMPIEDKYWSGAIFVKDEKIIPVINTALPRANQYFTAWHEIYHLIFDKVSFDHFIETDNTLEERKAEYFAACMLLNGVDRYFTELPEAEFVSKIFHCMSTFQAPYKAVLVSLYEYAIQSENEKLCGKIKEVFDLQFDDLPNRFRMLGLDDSLVCPSYVVNTSSLQEKIKRTRDENPELRYHEDNEEYLKNIMAEIALMEINGIGIKTVSCFIAEVGDIGRFDNPKQVQKLAGYAIVADSSGKHNGESRISHRGRKRLRYALYEAAISVIGKNKEFKEIHSYYRTREKNPLKKMQSVIAVACKLIRIFYTILTKGVDYDSQKMLNDIVRPEIQLAA